MKGLFYKELVLFRKTLILLSFIVLYFAGFGLISMIASSGDEQQSNVLFRSIGCFMAFFIAGFVSVELFKYDENSRWIGFAASTPTGLKGQILSKFILFFIINVAILMFFTIPEIVLSFFSDIKSAIKIYFLIFFVQNILNAIELPFVVRFGSDKGGAIKAAFIGTVLLLLCIYGLFGNIDFLLGDDPVGDLLRLSEKITVKKLEIILSITSLILYVLSYFISLLLYRKGAESYEQ